MFDFTELEAKNIPDVIDMPKGLMEDCDYVFSVTFTDPNAMDIKALAEATSRIISRDGESLATYPPPLGHEGLRKFIAEELSLSSNSQVLGFLYVGTPSSQNKKIPKLNNEDYVSFWN